MASTKGAMASLARAASPPANSIHPRINLAVGPTILTDISAASVPCVAAWLSLTAACTAAKSPRNVATPARPSRAIHNSASSSWRLSATAVSKLGGVGQSPLDERCQPGDDHPRDQEVAISARPRHEDRLLRQASGLFRIGLEPSEHDEEAKHYRPDRDIGGRAKLGQSFVQIRTHRLGTAR